MVVPGGYKALRQEMALVGKNLSLKVFQKISQTCINKKKYTLDRRPKEQSPELAFNSLNKTTGAELEVKEISMHDVLDIFYQTFEMSTRHYICVLQISNKYNLHATNKLKHHLGLPSSD